MGKIKNWFNHQSETSKNELMIGCIPCLILFFYSLYLERSIFPFSLSIFLARALGGFIAFLGVILIFSVPISYICFLIFRKRRTNRKNYFDYFCTTFEVVSFIVAYLVLKGAFLLYQEG